MSNQKISELTEAASCASTDFLAVAIGANTKKITIAHLPIVLPSSIQPAFNEYLFNNVQASYNGGVGFLNSYNGSNDSAVNDTSGPWRRATSAAAIGDTRYAGGSTASGRSDSNPIFIGVVRTPALMTGLRFRVGMFESRPLSNSDTASARSFGFRYSTAVPDGGWVGYCKDATTQTVSGTVAAIAASTIYVLKASIVGSTCLFQVNNSAVVTISSNIPTAGVDLLLDMEVTSLDGVAHAIDMQSLSCYTPSAGKGLLT